MPANTSPWLDPPYAPVCDECGQVAAVVTETNGRERCDACRERDHEPQGETVRLFTPAPPVMPGQLGL